MTIAYMAKRNITNEDIGAAKRLTELWESRKQELADRDEPINETEFATKILGMSQSMFNQLKSGKTTWNTDHVLLMAHVFNVKTTEFKKIPYLDFIPQPKKVIKNGLDLNKDGMLESILYAYEKLSNGHKDALATMANKLLLIDHPKDKRGGGALVKKTNETN
jgi:hypothetical protein